MSNYVTHSIGWHLSIRAIRVDEGRRSMKSRIRQNLIDLITIQLDEVKSKQNSSPFLNLNPRMANYCSSNRNSGVHSPTFYKNPFLMNHRGKNHFNRIELNKLRKQ